MIASKKIIIEEQSCRIVFLKVVIDIPSVFLKTIFYLSSTLFVEG